MCRKGYSLTTSSMIPRSQQRRERTYLSLISFDALKVNGSIFSSSPRAESVLGASMPSRISSISLDGGSSSFMTERILSQFFIIKSSLSACFSTEYFPSFFLFYLFSFSFFFFFYIKKCLRRLWGSDP